MNEFKKMIKSFVMSNLERKGRGGCFIAKVPYNGENNTLLTPSDVILLREKYEKTEEEVREVLFELVRDALKKVNKKRWWMF